jgi:biopolymer transport protein ExbD
MQRLHVVRTSNTEPVMQTRNVRAEPNVTPMIDVMLVLLIIFMAVGPLLATDIVPAAQTTLNHALS